jgi:hypothetical protein
MMAGGALSALLGGVAGTVVGLLFFVTLAVASRWLLTGRWASAIGLQLLRWGALVALLYGVTTFGWTALLGSTLGMTLALLLSLAIAGRDAAP